MRFSLFHFLLRKEKLSIWAKRTYLSTDIASDWIFHITFSKLINFFFFSRDFHVPTNIKFSFWDINPFYFIFVHFIISRISLQYGIQTTVTMTKRINLSTLLNIQGVKVSISSKCIRYNDPCKNGFKCVNLPGNYRCDFKTGYTRNNCETGAQLPLITQLVS